MKFKDRKDWKRRHLSECPHIGQDSQRSTVSRVFLCFYSVCVHRCMWNKCPLKERC